MEKNSLFELPYWKIEIQDWSIKKRVIFDKIQDYRDSDRLLYDDIHEIETSYNESSPDAFADMNSFVYDMFRSELNSFFVELKRWYMGDQIATFGNVLPYEWMLTSSWIQIYNGNNSYHPPHNHGMYGYSSVVYVNLEDDQSGTEFMAPFSNFADGMLLGTRPNVKEGDMIFFPSFVTHNTVPQKDLDNRIILSMNIHPVKNLNAMINGYKIKGDNY